MNEKRITLKYIGQRSISIPYGGTNRRLKPGEVFKTRNLHLRKMGYFVELDSQENVINTTLPTEPKNKIPQGKKKFKPFIGYDKMKRVSNPKISICIVSKDGDGIIQRCVDSIHKYVDYHDYEILICDTGTTDSNVLKYYEDIKDKGVSIFMDHTYNFSKNNNFLTTVAKGEVFLFLNNDVFMTYDAVSELMKYNNVSSVGCVGHRLVFDRDKSKIQHDGQTLYNDNGQWIRLGHHNIMKDITTVPNENTFVEGVTGACIMLDKVIFDKVNGFDEGYIDVLQDVDLNLKVSKLGYKNYCIREKAIIHVDHFSRKGDDTPDSKTDFQKYLKDWVHKGPYVKPKDSNHSVLIVGTKEDALRDVSKTIHSTVPYEYTFYNNKGNFSYSGQALNILSKLSPARYQFLTHQDIDFKEKEPFRKLDTHVERLGNFGVLGIAGVALVNGQIAGYNYFEHRYPQPHFSVETVDEFAMIVDKNNNLQFSEEFVGFHFYGADICLQAIEKGLKNYVVDINIFHNSGGAENLVYNNNQGWRDFKELGLQLYQKYNAKHPNFCTTTTLFNKVGEGKGKINFFIGSVIDEIPNSEVVVNVDI